MSTNHALSCPIDQLHLSGLLGCEDSDLELRERLSDIRYIAAKRLKTCESMEFVRVSDKFYHHRDLVYGIVRGGCLPPSPETWLPAFREALDSAAMYWGIKYDEESYNWDRGFYDDCPDDESRGKRLHVEPHGINSRGSVYANERAH